MIAEKILIIFHVHLTCLISNSCFLYTNLPETDIIRKAANNPLLTSEFYVCIKHGNISKKLP